MTTAGAARLNAQHLGIHWFRRDLRLADNPALQAHNGQPLLGVFCFDESLSAARCGKRRKAFLWQSLMDLKQQLEAAGGQLLVLEGEPEQALKALLETLHKYSFTISRMSTQALPCIEEQQQERAVRRVLNDVGEIALQSFSSYTLWSFAEVQKQTNKPLVGYSPFRKKMEPLLSSFANFDTGAAQPRFTSAATSLTTLLRALPLSALEYRPTDVSFYVEVGEANAQAQLQRYCASSGAIRHYKETRNRLMADAEIGQWFSSKLSAWLSVGTLSVKQVMHSIFEHEHHCGANDSTYWLKLELLWREFFQHLALQQQDRLFYGSAQRHRHPATAQATGSLTDWRHGTTSNRFVNAAMRELYSTGYMSNRARQNVASALIYDLALDWREGALWFEQQLLDYDPASNYGNWQYIAGIVANSRGGSRFNLGKQETLYDPEGRYVNTYSSA